MAAICLLALLQVPPGAEGAEERDDFNLGLLGALGNPIKGGIRVSTILSGGPAAQAEMREGDEIVALAGRTFPKGDDPIYFLVEAIEQVVRLKKPLLPLSYQQSFESLVLLLNLV